MKSSESLWIPRNENDRFPSLAILAAQWMADFLAAPDSNGKDPFVVTLEQLEFLKEFYRTDWNGRKRVLDRAVLSRPRGWGKSPFMAAIAAFEALGPALPDGFDANGQPVGKPWSTKYTPQVVLSAVTDTQTMNTYRPLQEMLGEGNAVDAYPGLEVMDTFISLPRGRIDVVSTSPRSVKGIKTVFAVMDQTEEWVDSNSGQKMYDVIRANVKKLGGTTLESPNAFTPGEDSVAEKSYETYTHQLEGKLKKDLMYYDHRPAPADTDIYDERNVYEALRVSYGDSSDDERGCVIHTPPCKPGWAPISSIADGFLDLNADPRTLRSDYLNQFVGTTDEFVSNLDWDASLNPDFEPHKGDVITLGFDGSRKRNRGTTDATALVGFHLDSKTLFPIMVWEEPDSAAAKTWEIPRKEVDQVVRETFDEYTVVGFYADPPYFEDLIANWEADYRNKLKIKASVQHPIEFWMKGGGAKMSQWIEEFQNGIEAGEIKHDGSSVLNRHVLNTKLAYNRFGLALRKETPHSDRKIDAAVCAVLAYAVGMDAISGGFDKKKVTRAPIRLR